MNGRPVRSERGSASMLVLAMMIVVLMLGVAGTCIAGYLVAAHRARSAADLAALGGASAVAAGHDPCAPAGRVADRNGARLVSCRQAGDEVDYVVTVRVEVTVAVRVKGLPRRLGATAYAGSVPS